MEVCSSNLRKLVILCVVFLMLGISGMIGSASEEPLDEKNDGYEDKIHEEQNTRSSDSRSTEIAGYLRLCTDWSGNPHDGNYGPNNGYYFYLNNVHNNFRIYLMNIDSQDNYFRYVNTTLTRGSTPATAISITDPYYNQTFMSYTEVDNFDYDIKIGVDTEITSYQLTVNVNFVVVDTNMNEIQKSGKIYINLILSSRMRTYSGDSNLKLEAVDKFGNTEPLYSDAKNQLITLPDTYSASGSLSGVSLTLSLPTNFALQSDLTTESGIGTYGNFVSPLWLLNDAGAENTEPAVLSGTVEIAYTQSNVAMTEKGVPIKIEIKKTPIIGLTAQIAEEDIGSKSGETFVSNVEVYQGTVTKSFPLVFKNTGNIDLKNVEVELYTDNAAFFFKSNFYYDENDYSYKRTYGKTVLLGDLVSGAVMTKSFSTEIIKNLPPGLYKVPIRYTAKYTQNLIDIDLDMNDYHKEIIAARATNNKGYTPFILVNVKEGDDENDVTEPDLYASSTIELKPGMRNVKLAVELTNLENYQLNNVNTMIHTGYLSPLQPLNEINRTYKKINSLEQDFTMYAANNPVYSNKNIIHFLVDVYSEAEPGIYDVSITVTCFDPYNQERITFVTVPLSILPVPPEFVVSDTSTNDILPNENFSLKVKVYNCGGCKAENVYMMFNGSSNLLSAIKGIEGPKSISRNDDSEFEFEIMAGEVEPGRIYTVSMLLSYEDSSGNFYPFDVSSELLIPLYVKEPVSPPKPRFVLTDVSTSYILANGNFSLKVKVFNVGEASARNVMLMFNGSSNLFSATQSVLGPKVIMEDEEAMFEFTIVSGEIEEGKTYKSNILICFEDYLDNIYDFDENPSFPVELQAKAVEPEVVTIVKKEKVETWELDVGIAMVILGLFILISAIAFGAIRLRTSKKEKPKPTEPKEESRVKQEPPKPSTEPQKKSLFGKKGEVIDMTKPEYPQEVIIPEETQVASGQVQDTYQPEPAQTYYPGQNYSAQSPNSRQNMYQQPQKATEREPLRKY